MKITFPFEEKTYEVVGIDAYRDVIQLPDGRILKVLEWDKSIPPQPMKLKVLERAQAIEISETQQELEETLAKLQRVEADLRTANHELRAANSELIGFYKSLPDKTNPSL